MRNASPETYGLSDAPEVELMESLVEDIVRDFVRAESTHGHLDADGYWVLTSDGAQYAVVSEDGRIYAADHVHRVGRAGLQMSCLVGTYPVSGAAPSKADRSSGERRLRAAKGALLVEEEGPFKSRPS